MAEIKSWKCDECGVQKMESNHWVLGFAPREPGVKFYAWGEAYLNLPNAIHLCGEGCAAKVLSRQVSAWRMQ